MQLFFQHKRIKNQYGSYWLIRKQVSWTNDGKFTIGKIHKTSVGQLRLSLNEQLELEDVRAIVAFMNTIEAAG